MEGCCSGALRYSLSYAVTLGRGYTDHGEAAEVADFHFRSPPTKETQGLFNLDTRLQDNVASLRSRILELETNGKSQWRYLNSIVLRLHITKLGHLKIGRHIVFRPKAAHSASRVSAKARASFVNVVNRDDDFCVVYNTILSIFWDQLSRVDKTNPANLRPFFSHFNLKGLKFPLDVAGIALFEALNRRRHNLAICIWNWSTERHLTPFYISTNHAPGARRVHMFLLNSTDGRQHTVYVRNLTFFLRDLRHGRKFLFCDSCCLYKTQTPSQLRKHYKSCCNPNYKNVRFPPPDRRHIQPPSSYSFNKPPLRAFFDFETCTPQPPACARCFSYFSFAKCTEPVVFRCPHLCDCAMRAGCQHFYSYSLAQSMVAYCYSLIFVSSDDRVVKERFYVGLDAAADLSKYLASVSDWAARYISKNLPLAMEPHEQELFDSATCCQHCSVPFGALLPCFRHRRLTCSHCCADGVAVRRAIKCRDHCHWSGKYRQALCQGCNLNLRHSTSVPCYAHNLRGFDGQLVLQALNSRAKFSVLAKNSEKIISIDFLNFRLVDTSSFLLGSLSRLVDNLITKGVEHFRLLQQSDLSVSNDGRFCREKFDLLLRKGVFPYEWVTDLQALSVPHLPPKEAFYSSLSGAHISDQDYAHALRVWRVFGCRTLQDYARVYCRLDTLQLADCWAAFCSTATRTFGVCPEANFVSFPQYAFACFRQHIWKNQRLRLLSLTQEHSDFYEHIRTGVRGGQVFVNRRAAFDGEFALRLEALMNPAEQAQLARLKRLRRRKALEEHARHAASNPDDGSSIGHYTHQTCRDCDLLVTPPRRRCLQHNHQRVILSFDFNNLYGASMCYGLPYNRFKQVHDPAKLASLQRVFDRVSAQKTTDNDLHMFSPTNSVGYVFVSSITFPARLHAQLKEFPPAAQPIVVSFDMLSPLQQQKFKAVFDTESMGEEKKLVHNFYVRSNYTAHMLTLYSAAKLGAVVTLEKAWSFAQKPFARDYVTMCSQLRGQATNEADTQLYKNFCNIIFGKFIEDVLNRIDIKFFWTEDAFTRKLRVRPDCPDPVVVNRNLVQVAVPKRSVLLNKPQYVGFSVLEISKHIMLTFFYEVVRPTFGRENVCLLYSDTDSFYFEFAGHTYDEVLTALEPHIDFSNFDPAHPRHSRERRCQFGFVKVDTANFKILAFQGCRKKCYKIYLDNGDFHLPPVGNGGKIKKRVTKIKGVSRASRVADTDFILSLTELTHVCSLKTFKIESHVHRLSLVERHKMALNSFDNSSFQKTCGLCSLPFGSSQNRTCGSLHCKYVRLLLDTWSRAMQDGSAQRLDSSC